MVMGLRLVRWFITACAYLGFALASLIVGSLFGLMFGGGGSVVAVLSFVLLAWLWQDLPAWNWYRIAPVAFGLIHATWQLTWNSYYSAIAAERFGWYLEQGTFSSMDSRITGAQAGMLIEWLMPVVYGVFFYWLALAILRRKQQAARS